MTCCTTASPVILDSSIRNGSTVLGGVPCDANENPLDPAPRDKNRQVFRNSKNTQETHKPTLSNVASYDHDFIRSHSFIWYISTYPYKEL